MNKALQRYLEAATGLTNLTKAKAEQIAQQLVRQGEFASDNVGDIVDELLERQRRNREMVTSLVKSETSRVVRAMGLATTSEVERLERQVGDLKRKVARAEQAAASSGGPREEAAERTPKKTPKKASKKASKRTAKKASKKTAKKASKKASKKTAKKTAGGRSTSGSS